MTSETEVAAALAPLHYRVRPASKAGVPPIVMLHGLGGDERAIWELEVSLHRGGLLVAPRAPYLQSTGGYGWLPQIGAWPPKVEEFADSVQILERMLTYLERNHELDRSSLVLLGFSQGAAMAFASAMTPVNGLTVMPAALAVAAGHLPDGDLSPLRGLPVFWGHGTRDELIPVTIARTDVERLRAAGAQVIYCEADVTHKFGMACLRELKEWIAAGFGRQRMDEPAP